MNEQEVPSAVSSHCDLGLLLLNRTKTVLTEGDTAHEALNLRFPRKKLGLWPHETPAPTWQPVDGLSGVFLCGHGFCSWPQLSPVHSLTHATTLALAFAAPGASQGLCLRVSRLL